MDSIPFYGMGERDSEPTNLLIESFQTLHIALDVFFFLFSLFSEWGTFSLSFFVVVVTVDCAVAAVLDE